MKFFKALGKSKSCRMIFEKVLILLTALCLSACNKYPKEVRDALLLSGKNKSEIRKVLEHYSKSPADSLKLKAAYFLIGNMPGKYYYQGSLFNYFYEFVEKVEYPRVLDSIIKIHGHFSTDRLELKYDIEQLKASFLIDNIDMAFKVWKEQPWGKNINFSQFCEYILPYRNDNEIPDYHRAEIYKRYNKVLDSVRNTNGDALDACFAVNNVLKKEGWSFSTNAGFLPYFSAQRLLTQKGGNCRDMVAKTLFIMRALGIPVASEFTPNWGNRNGGHEWNVVLDKNGKNHSFMGIENNTSKEIEGGEAHYTFSKVFLKTFSRQDYCSDLINNKNDIPPFFTNSFIKDVTDENDGSLDISVQLSESKYRNYKYAYICVFDNTQWVPVHWAKISKNKVIFKKMMTGITYLPTYFKNGVLIPANYPFILTKTGKIIYLSPNNLIRDTLKLNRKYPVLMKSVYAGRMKGGQFQASNNPSFTNAITIYTIPYPETEMKWYDVLVQLQRPYKYYRYLSPNGGWGNIAELGFYFRGKKIIGKVIGSPGSYLNKPDLTFMSAMDGDESTYFDYPKPANGWVGLQLNNSIKIDEFRFLPRTDDNGIDIGQKYELVYWNNNRWISSGIKIADDNKLIYKDIPTNGLYLLHNLTKGKEERIFTYEGGKQIWW